VCARVQYRLLLLRICVQRNAIFWTNLKSAFDSNSCTLCVWLLIAENTTNQNRPTNFANNGSIWMNCYYLQWLCCVIAPYCHIFSCEASLSTCVWRQPGLLAAIAWPAALIGMASVIDNPWSVCTQRSLLAGRQLAEVLLSRQQVCVARQPTDIVNSTQCRYIFSQGQTVLAVRQCYCFINSFFSSVNICFILFIFFIILFVAFYVYLTLLSSSVYTCSRRCANFFVIYLFRWFSVIACCKYVFVRVLM